MSRIAIGSLGGIANPAVQSVMSRQAGPSAQGELQGAVASLGGIAAVISPAVHDAVVQLLRAATPRR